MDFIWDHDQLRTVYGEIDGGDREDRNWTTFAMRQREPDKVTTKTICCIYYLYIFIY